MRSVLERNLEALLQRAYVPARMHAPFRESLRSAWLDRVAPPPAQIRALPRIAAILLGGANWIYVAMHFGRVH